MDVGGLVQHKCSRCRYSSYHYKLLLKHLELIHSQEAGFKYICYVQHCPCIYSSIRTYRNHLKKKHPEFFQEHFHVRQQQDSIDLTYAVDEGHSDDDRDIDNQVALQPRAVVPKFDFQKRIATFTVNLREKFKASEAVCSAVVQEMQTMVQLNNDQLAARIQQNITAHGVELPPGVSISDITESQTSLYFKSAEIHTGIYSFSFLM